MTNEEKYKTQSERAAAFTAFCNRFKFCKGCPARAYDEPDSDIISDMNMHCHFNWLALEAEEEKPLPCPCCGAEVKVFHITISELDQGYHVFCGKCGLQTGIEATSDKAVALWNRRMK